MIQNTFLKYSEVEPFEVESITTVSTVCPACKQTIRFVAPDDIAMKDYKLECDYYKREINRLHYELTKMEKLYKLSNGFHT